MRTATTAASTHTSSRSRRSAALTLALAAACAGPPEDGAGAATGSAPQALRGPRVHADGRGPDERAVVRLRNLNHGSGATFCNGTLLTTRVILTAAHCLDAMSPENAIAELVYDDGEQTPQTLQLPIRREPRPSFAPPSPRPPDDADVALVFVGENEGSGVPFASPPRPLLQTRMGRPPTRTPAGRPGAAAFQTFVDAEREAVSWDEIRLVGGTFRFAVPEDTTVAAGSSGAPLFSTSVDGRRVVFGVLASHDNHLGQDRGFPIFADVTRAEVAAFIAEHASDRARSSRWYERHGERWIGETGYTGPCEPAGDPDCDGWLSVQDDCPDVFDPDQEDSDGGGVGDACAAASALEIRRDPAARDAVVAGGTVERP